MTKPPRPQGNYVIGPVGSPLTIADLPPPGTKRWVPRRKAEVVAAVRGGLLSLQEACSRYSLTVDEFRSWQESNDQYGLRVCAQRVSSDIVPDIGGERGGKKDSVARSPARTARPVVFCLSNPLKDGRSFSSRQESAQQELQPRRGSSYGLASAFAWEGLRRARRRR